MFLGKALLIKKEYNTRNPNEGRKRESESLEEEDEERVRSHRVVIGMRTAARFNPLLSVFLILRFGGGQTKRSRFLPVLACLVSW